MFKYVTVKPEAKWHDVRADGIAFSKSYAVRLAESEVTPAIQNSEFLEISDTPPAGKQVVSKTLQPLF